MNLFDLWPTWRVWSAISLLPFKWINFSLLWPESPNPESSKWKFVLVFVFIPWESSGGYCIIWTANDPIHSDNSLCEVIKLTFPGLFIYLLGSRLQARTVAYIKYNACKLLCIYYSTIKAGVWLFDRAWEKISKHQTLLTIPMWSAINGLNKVSLIAILLGPPSVFPAVQ